MFDKYYKLRSFNIILLFIIVCFFLFMKIDYKKTLVIKDQKNLKVYFKCRIKNGDTLIYEWIHSFEHIPWTEEYEILEDNQLKLKKIIVAGFGAGIPEKKGKTFVDKKGNIIMSNLNQLFDGIYWINSNTALKQILLNNKVLINGNDLPHHRSLSLIIEEKISIGLR